MPSFPLCRSLPYLDAVNEIISRSVSSDIPMAESISSYLFQTKGKQLRSLLTVTFALAHTESAEVRTLHLAAAVEMLHTATLLHDDVIDASVLRRGMPSAAAGFGNKVSILGGDLLFARAFKLMTDSGSIEAMRLLAGAAARIVEGEIHQAQSIHDPLLPVEQYLRIAQAKTAELFAAACAIGALSAGACERGLVAAGEYGCNLGIAFQIMDDVRDCLESCDDLRQGHVTLPVLLACAADDNKEFWCKTFSPDTSRDDESCIIIKDKIKKHKSIEGSLKFAHAYGKMALKSLQMFSAGNPLVNELENLVGYCLQPM